MYQRDDYYPFGMEIAGTVTNPKNEYLYNKKELQEETQEYDYGARYYDPVIARWTSVDPLAEKSRRWSPYHYVEDNPIRYTDPDGMECDGCRTGEAIIGGSLMAGGTMIVAASPTVVGEVVAVPAATVTVVTGMIVGGGVMLWHSIFGHNDSPTPSHLAPAQSPPNPHGSKGDPTHQKQVKDLADQKAAEHPGKDVLQEQKIAHDGSRRKPDVQVVNRETGKVEEVHEVERHPTHKRNRNREAEYDRLKIPNETHPLKTPGS